MAFRRSGLLRGGIVDDFGNSLADARALSGLGAISGVLETTSDVDVFSIDLLSGQEISYSLDLADAPGLTEFATITIRDANGTELDAVTGVSEASFPPVPFIAPTSGTYFFEVHELDTVAGSPLGQYTLTLGNAVPDGVDLAVSAELLVPPDPGLQLPGFLTFGISNLGMTAAQNVGFSIVLSTDEVIDASDFVLESEGPIALGPQAGTEVSTSIVFPTDDVAPGTYRIGVVVDQDNLIDEADETNNVVFTDSFVFGFPDLAIAGPIEVLRADGTSTDDRPIALGETVVLSVLVRNEGIAATREFEVLFDVETSPSSSLSPAATSVDGLAAGAEIRVQLSLEIPLDARLDGGFATTSVLIDPGLEVREEDRSNNTAVGPTLALADLGSDDHGDNAGAATTIALGTQQGGIIQDLGAPDVDFFSFFAFAGDRYRLTLAPDSTVTAPLSAVRADVIDSEQARTVFAAVEDGPLVLSGIAQVSGFHSVAVSSGALDSADGLGGYALSFDSLTADLPDDHSDSREGATALTENVILTGVLDSINDVDVFVYDLVALGALGLRITKTDGTGFEGVSVQVIETEFAQFFDEVNGSSASEVFSASTVGSTLEKTFSFLGGSGPTYFAVSGPAGAYEIEITQFDEIFDPDQSDFFVFDGAFFDDLRGIVNDPDIFLMQDDGQRDLIRNFEFGLDRIDVSEFGAENLNDLTIENQTRSDGSVNWVNIFDRAGDLEIGVRFGDGTPLDAGAFTPGDFVFLPPTARTAGLQQQGTTGFDDFRGVAGSEVYGLLDDGVRDLIRAFQFGLDQIDVSAFAENFGDLTISNQTRGDGSVNWVNIADFRGEIEVGIRFGDGTPLDAAALSARDFIFSDVPIQRDQTLQDLPGFTDLAGADTRDTFVMLDDGERDLIRGFDPDNDMIDVSAFAESLADLTITNQTRSNGSVNWVNIADFFGEVEMGLRFDGGTLDADRLDADNFIFSDVPIERVPLINVLTDSFGFSDLRATSGADLFVMQDDGVRDIIRGFEPGRDQIDLTAFGLSSFNTDIATSNLLRRDGSVNWVEVFAGSGDEADFIVRFDAGTLLDQSSITADDFIF
ncbi:MAG: CARDB domain-containing protein [Paracoccaceae bacterium]